ncbi:MAG: hypothetical protein U9N11_06815 [Campylobacterota bacterium]|nr:hypothetical protein [Campylobacterota bacterium]
MINILKIFFIVMLLLTHSVHAEVKVTVKSSEKWEISKHMLGMHMVYTTAKDSLYEDGSIAQWAKEVSMGTSRYPGGSIVKYWDWKNPNGLRSDDIWNTKWDDSKQVDPSKWMSLDEYISFVETSGITPMFGVNSLSGKKYNRVDDSIQRAVDMVSYVKEKGHGGAIWYIGNEEVHQQGGIVKYAKMFKKHATAMKAVDPDIKILWNDNEVTANRLKRFLANDGGTSDGLETHGKWPYGGDPKRTKAGTYDEWLVEFPMSDRKHNRNWRSAANTYRTVANNAGRKNYLIANNEYGLGKSENVIGFDDRYSVGLLMIDMLQEHFIGNWDMTCFWDNTRGDYNGLISKPTSRMNPLHLGMSLLGDAQGGQMLELKTNKDYIYGFASKTDNKLYVYVLNKTLNTEELKISIPKSYSIKNTSAKMIQDTADSWGEIIDIDVNTNSEYSVQVGALTYTRIVFDLDGIRTPLSITTIDNSSENNVITKNKQPQIKGTCNLGTTISVLVNNIQNNSVNCLDNAFKMSIENLEKTGVYNIKVLSKDVNQTLLEETSEKILTILSEDSDGISIEMQHDKSTYTNIDQKIKTVFTIREYDNLDSMSNLVIYLPKNKNIKWVFPKYKTEETMNSENIAIHNNEWKFVKTSFKKKLVYVGKAGNFPAKGVKRVYIRGVFQEPIDTKNGIINMISELKYKNINATQVSQFLKSTFTYIFE